MDVPVKGLQDIAYTIWEVLFDEPMCLARLTDVDDDTCDIREFLHDRIPFFFVLLHFLFDTVVSMRDIKREIRSVHIAS